MLNHTDHNPEMNVAYVEALHRMSCNTFTHMAWLITDAYPKMGDDGLSFPNNMNKVINLAHDVWRVVAGFPTPMHMEIALHIPKENRSKATVPL